MIIQTGLRTDIPAFYAKWFANRLREGFVCVRNPYHPTAVTRYRLSPEVVDLIGFCTKNPAPMLPYLDLLHDYGQFWFVTITPYGREIEPNVPEKEMVLETFRKLSSQVGKNCIVWRYDPIFISETYSVERHLAEFERMARTLSGYTETCVISFIDLYKKVKRNFPEAREVAREERLQLGKAFIEITKVYGMTLKTCAEGEELTAYGADCSGCMTIGTYEKALGKKLHAPKQKASRDICACHLSGDIGQYDTCAHFCKYCYANTDAEMVCKNISMHDPTSSLLVGQLQPEDIVHEAKQKLWQDGQLELVFR